MSYACWHELSFYNVHLIGFHEYGFYLFGHTLYIYVPTILTLSHFAVLSVYWADMLTYWAYFNMCLASWTQNDCM